MRHDELYWTGYFKRNLLNVLTAILDRFEADPTYPFIDTKLDVVTGRDFVADGSAASSDFKGRSVIFPWIQGRGLEALAGHYWWIEKSGVLPKCERLRILTRIVRMVETVVSKMESLRSLNAGRLPFMMTPDGEPVSVGSDGSRLVSSYLTPSDDPATFSDLFYAKGLAAAGSLLADRRLVFEAENLFRMTVSDIREYRFYSGQISFDPRNRVVYEPGKRQQGPFMIAMGAFALFMRIHGNKEWLDVGVEFAKRVMRLHVNSGQWPGLLRDVLVEAVDAEGKPWRDDDGVVICDPGHSIEFVGLSAKFAAAAERAGFGSPFDDEFYLNLYEILTIAFECGWNKTVGGICKTFDARSGRPVNDDMPWWPLPETIRAAALTRKSRVVAADSERVERLSEIIDSCAAAFRDNFVNDNAYSMAYQTVSAAGIPVSVIPATPDADPGYHTGLSVIDYLDAAQKE